MPYGGRLVIRTQNVQVCEGASAVPPGTYVLLSVADTGCGMSAEVREQIFEPFFTTKAPGRGTGLGLAMVYGMVEQHGGTIHVYSEPGEGTTFKIYLPVATREESPALPSSEHRVVGGNETLLIAEDDPFVRAFLVRILERAGYKTLVATDGQDALRVFCENSQSVQLLVSDVIMPYVGGRALYARLKQLKPDLRVIFCTGHDPEVNPAETISQQGLPLLNKPVEPSVLLHMVRAVLDASDDDLYFAGNASRSEPHSEPSEVDALAIVTP
jgi:two-component system cell cycle sensor histidine kinase/response regulator CckA